MSNIQAIRGFNDILPAQTPLWQYLENAVVRIADQYGYNEIRLPILEKTELFVRGVGEVTDIVEKEIYAFEDRNGDHLALRPEGTAGCVRAVLEHGLIHNQIQKLWYVGPMFRHERPQAGRYRQFYQIGFEAFGIVEPYLDAELILLTARLWRELGLLDKLQLQINTLGSTEARHAYRELLIQYFEKHHDQLDEDSKKRLHKNPLRILDSKNLALKELIQEAPKLLDHLDTESIQHFEAVKQLLTVNGIKYVVNPCLVRGLDYYNRTVFEWVSDQLGAQATVCAGGRYDGLVEQLGGKATPAFGFAMGIERLILLLEQNAIKADATAPLVYFISSGEEAKGRAFELAEVLRNHFMAPIIFDAQETSFKSQMKKADKSGAQFALILGTDELKTGTIALKFLRQDLPQTAVSQSEIVAFLKANIT